MFHQRCHLLAQTSFSPPWSCASYACPANPLQPPGPHSLHSSHPANKQSVECFHTLFTHSVDCYHTLFSHSVECFHTFFNTTDINIASQCSAHPGYKEGARRLGQRQFSHHIQRKAPIYTVHQQPKTQHARKHVLLYLVMMYNLSECGTQRYPAASAY